MTVLCWVPYSFATLFSHCWTLLSALTLGFLDDLTLGGAQKSVAVNRIIEGGQRLGLHLIIFTIIFSVSTGWRTHIYTHSAHYIPPSFKIPLFPLSFTHCLATHLSASDSFSTMALYKSIYLLTYLLTLLYSVRQLCTRINTHSTPCIVVQCDTVIIYNNIYNVNGLTYTHVYTSQHTTLLYSVTRLVLCTRTNTHSAVL